VSASDVLYIAGGGAAGLLLNLTANKVPERYHAPFLKWGWFAIGLYFTLLLMSIDGIEQRVYSLGRSKSVSYVIAAVIGGSLAICYWFLVNRAYSILATTNESSAVKKEEPKPILSGQIDQIANGVLYNDAGNETGKFLLTQVSVKNTGVDSIATGWSLLIKWKDGKTMTAQPTHFLKGLQSVDHAFPGGFTPDDYIYDKTMRPIPHNGLVRGWVSYVFQDVTLERLREEGTELVVSFEDISGTPYEARYTITALPGKELFYLPGSSVPFRAPETGTTKSDETPLPVKRITVTSEQISSEDESLPWGLRLIIQSTVTISPAHFRVECSGPIGKNAAIAGPAGGGAVMGDMTTHPDGTVNWFEFSQRVPPLSPDRPIVVRIFSVNKVSCLRVVEIP
jgi:hypothetical protein